jgi:NADPH:quinone reductase-like Zn-dependent oxidoreductase
MARAWHSGTKCRPDRPNPWKTEVDRISGSRSARPGLFLVSLVSGGLEGVPIGAGGDPHGRLEVLAQGGRRAEARAVGDMVDGLQQVPGQVDALPDEPLPRAEAFMLVEPDLAGLKAITALVDAGRLRVELDTVLPLEDAAKAHEVGATNRATGKIVLTVS